jgi:hypothetical protein
MEEEERGDKKTVKDSIWQALLLGDTVSIMDPEALRDWVHIHRTSMDFFHSAPRFVPWKPDRFTSADYQRIYPLLHKWEALGTKFPNSITHRQISLPFICLCPSHKSGTTLHMCNS